MITAVKLRAKVLKTDAFGSLSNYNAGDQVILRYYDTANGRFSTIDEDSWGMLMIDYELLTDAEAEKIDAAIKEHLNERD